MADNCAQTEKLPPLYDLIAQISDLCQLQLQASLAQRERDVAPWYSGGSSDRSHQVERLSYFSFQPIIY